ncbi:MAG: L-threonylcarbamoyladenylate synthase [Sphingobium sp.]
MNEPARYETQTLGCDKPAIAAAAALLRAGGIVAVPTETVYGLAGNALDSSAVAAIYAAKGRPSFNPLIVHVADREGAGAIADFNPVAERLASAFWPGALTMVLPIRSDSGLSPLITAGLPTVALRMPAHDAMRALITASGVPLAAPSANASGGISSTSAAHVRASLDGRIPLILDAGDTAQGLESTIVAPEADRIRLLRPGPVTAERLEVIAGVPVTRDHGHGIEAPGQMTSHYAPSKPLRLDASRAEADEYLIGFGRMDCDFNLSATGDLVVAAARLFSALHAADASDKTRIAVARIPMRDIGVAINDRLTRAAA